MKVYKEITEDRGWAMRRGASNNFATYILTSAYAHDLYNDYVKKYERAPTSQWLNRHFSFELIHG